jgi:ribosomal protein S20
MNWYRICQKSAKIKTVFIKKFCNFKIMKLNRFDNIELTTAMVNFVQKNIYNLHSKEIFRIPQAENKSSSPLPLN